MRDGDSMFVVCERALARGERFRGRTDTESVKRSS